MSTTTTEGTVTPRPRQNVQGVHPDTLAIQSLLGAMQSTIGSLGQTFETLNSQSSKMMSLGPSQKDTMAQIEVLRRDIHEQRDKQSKRITEMKDFLWEMLQAQIVDHMREQIRAQIRDEIVTQVAQQVEAQITEHIPVPLQQQSEENKRQLNEVQISLANSKARSANSNLHLSYLDEPLEVVLKADGTKSEFFPADLRSLFSYDLEWARKLVKDYGLDDDEVLEVNFNRFISHVGIQFQLIILPGA